MPSSLEIVPFGSAGIGGAVWKVCACHGKPAVHVWSCSYKGHVCLYLCLCMIDWWLWLWEDNVFIIIVLFKGMHNVKDADHGAG